jgi:ATPase subunit of ABC transporter with duplicated ATPase domains
MRQFIGQMTEGTVRDLLFGVSQTALRTAARELDDAELALMESDDEPTQMQYAHAIADYADAGGYDAEVLFDVVTMAAMGESFERMRWRAVSTLSGGEQKRLVLELLLRGSADILLLDEPDNYLDVPGKTWLEQQLRETPKTVLLISHDRELLNQCASHVSRSSSVPWATRRGCTAAGSRPSTRRARTGSPGWRSSGVAGTRST